MAEREQNHQIEMETAAQQLTARDARTGQIIGLIVSLSAFATSLASLAMGSENTAMVIGGTTVVGLVTAFVTGRRGKKSE